MKAIEESPSAPFELCTNKRNGMQLCITAVRCDSHDMAKYPLKNMQSTLTNATF